MPITEIEPTNKNFNDCESSVLTTMPEGIVNFTSSYDKYILNVH